MAYLVHNRDASLNEYYVSRALDRLKLDYYFQYAPFGNKGLRGEFVVDFFLPNIPGQMVIEVYGEYWHSGQLGADDKLRAALIQQALPGVPYVILWGNETDTQDKANEAVAKNLGTMA